MYSKNEILKMFSERKGRFAWYYMTKTQTSTYTQTATSTTYSSKKYHHTILSDVSLCFGRICTTGVL